MQPTLNSYNINSWDNEVNQMTDGRNSTSYPDCVFYTRKFSLDRGDIVMVKDPQKSGYLIKRVIGLPGDTITPLGFNKVEQEPVKLEEGKVWIESDTAGFGFRDSSLFGPINRHLIEAKITSAIKPNDAFWTWQDIKSEIPEAAMKRLKIAS